MFLVVIRLFYWQILQSDQLSAKAEAEILRLLAERDTLRDKAAKRKLFVKGDLASHIVLERLKPNMKWIRPNRTAPKE